MSDKIFRGLAADGFEYLGSVQLGGAVVVGDPTLLARTPANGAYHAALTERGNWHLLGRADGGDDLTEVVWVHEDALASFWEVYDAADLAAEVPGPTGRVLVVEAARKDDAALRQSAFEPDAEGLPWLWDRGAVLLGDPDHPTRVFQPPGDAYTRVRLFALNFGEAPVMRVGRSLDERVDRD